MSLNITEIFTKKYLVEYLSRNKSLILASLLLFILSVIVGIIASESIKPIMIELLKQVFEKAPENPTFIQQALFLFSNNMRANIIILLGGILFSIISVLIIILNGIIVGFTSTLLPPTIFIVGIFPHGIFEIPATVLSLVGALLITKLEINIISLLLAGDLRNRIGELSVTVKDIILTVMITIVLLIIAAIIEAGVTPTLLNIVL